jgi:NAD-dependent deacetylase
MKKVVVFTGAGISAESGINTFRDSGGLWENVDINEVATPAGWKKNPARVLDFYNDRRKQVLEAKPNKAHIALAELQKKYEVYVITQNIDNLHERAGSKAVLHLHGEVTKSRSSLDPALVYEIKGGRLELGEKCGRGSQLRPHIVWFGEEVPNMAKAYELTSGAELFIVIGTSLNVYPAAGLLDYAPAEIPKYLIDPAIEGGADRARNLKVIKEKAGKGVPDLVKMLLG